MKNNEKVSASNGQGLGKEEAVAVGSVKTIVYLPDNLGGVDLIRRTVYGTLRKEGRLLDALAFHKEAKGVEAEGALVDIARKYVAFDWYWL